jgi:hypothetical protein
MTLDITRDKSAPRRGYADAKSHARSRVSNGRDVLPNVDGRSLIARRYRDIASAILADQGGLEQCSESRLQLIRRFSAAAVLAEQMEARLANGEEIDVSEHALLCSTLTRLASRLGIDRVPKPVMSLGDLLAQDLEEQRLAQQQREAQAREAQP